MAGVRAQSVWGMQRGWYGETCANTSSRWDQRHCSWHTDRAAAILFPSNCLVQCGLGSIQRPESAIWWSNKIKTIFVTTHKRTIIVLLKLSKAIIWHFYFGVMQMPARSSLCWWQCIHLLVVKVLIEDVLSGCVLLVNHVEIYAFYERHRKSHELIMRNGVNQWALYNNFTAIKATAITINKVVCLNETSGSKKFD